MVISNFIFFSFSLPFWFCFFLALVRRRFKKQNPTELDIRRQLVKEHPVMERSKALIAASGRFFFSSFRHFFSKLKSKSNKVIYLKVFFFWISFYKRSFSPSWLILLSTLIWKVLYWCPYQTQRNYTNKTRKIEHSSSGPICARSTTQSTYCLLLSYWLVNTFMDSHCYTND